MSSFSWSRLCHGTFMIFGITVGAGMLGIPAMTADAGFYPALFVTILVWLFMLVTGMLLLEVTFRMPSGANVISLAKRFLGVHGQWCAGLLFFFLYGCLLVAYFSGGAPLIEQGLSFLGIQLSAWAYKVLFALLFGSVLYLGAHWISWVNLILSLGMFISYGCLLYEGSSLVQMKYLAFSQGTLAVGAIPVLFSAFGFHNVIPSLAHHLKQDKRVLRWSLVLGTFFACLFYGIWQWLILGSVSVEALRSVRELGLPVTYALQQGNVYVLGQLFAFLALTTSFLGVGFSFIDFLRDGFYVASKKNSYGTRSYGICALCTVLLPLFFVLWIPTLFEQALGIAGGFGESLLNGILPVLLFLQMRALCYKNKPLHVIQKSGLAFLVFLSLFVVLLECKALFTVP